MKLLLSNYKTLVFDCDGVILNSNKVKTEAFYLASLPYGTKAADELVKYHVSNGGVSRYKKFEYFLEQIVPQFSNVSEGPKLEDLLESYASKVKHGLLNCDVAKGLVELRNETEGIPWLIVSGGDQGELREVFSKRGLNDFFDGGIFGSPDNKEVILNREIVKKNIINPALFLGDSKYDYQASTSAGLDFVFLSAWSEVVNSSEWCDKYSIASHASLNNVFKDINQAE